MEPHIVQKDGETYTAQLSFSTVGIPDGTDLSATLAFAGVAG